MRFCLLVVSNAMGHILYRFRDIPNKTTRQGGRIRAFTACLVLDVKKLHQARDMRVWHASAPCTTTSRRLHELPTWNFHANRSTHSLTHCCAWPAEGRNVLHIERSWPAIQAAPTDRPTPSSTCCSQFLRGRPVSSGRSAGVGFYWQLKCLRSRCVLR